MILIMIRSTAADRQRIARRDFVLLLIKIIQFELMRFLEDCHVIYRNYCQKVTGLVPISYRPGLSLDRFFGAGSARRKIYEFHDMFTRLQEFTHVGLIIFSYS